MLVLTLGVCLQIASACDCRGLKVPDAVSHAQIIFRGTIVALRDSAEKPEGRYGGRNYKIAVFAVNRVWKGEVKGIFEMPAPEEIADCVGSWPDLPRVGNELLVYAQRSSPYRQYVTDICTRTQLSDKAAVDFKALGLGREPSK